MSEASRLSGRPVISLSLEAMRLRFSIGRLGMSEYLDFRLYMNDLPPDAKPGFAGWRAQLVLEQILVDDYAKFLSLDKITMYSLLAGYGLPIPALRAVYRTRRPLRLLQLDSPQALATHLENPSSTPVYLKPSFGAYGRGNTLVRRSERGNLILGDGTTVKVREFCEALDERRGLGWILQEPLAPHPRIAEACGDRISGVRIHTFLSSEGPSVTRAVWKINAGKEESDNFRRGASGNMLAALDLDTGRVTRVVTGTGFTQKVGARHPVSGWDLTGFLIPHWNEIKSIACDAHLAFPGFLCPGWDIAVCEDGPKILEVNFFGAVDLSQYADRRGFIDEQFLSLMRARGIEDLLRGGRGSSQRSPKNNRLGRRTHHWNW